jgi:hypothetical protein
MAKEQEHKSSAELLAEWRAAERATAAAVAAARVTAEARRSTTSANEAATDSEVAARAASDAARKASKAADLATQAAGSALVTAEGDDARANQTVEAAKAAERQARDHYQARLNGGRSSQGVDSPRTS